MESWKSGGSPISFSERSRTTADGMEIVMPARSVGSAATMQQSSTFHPHRYLLLDLTAETSMPSGTSFSGGESEEESTLIIQFNSGLTGLVPACRAAFISSQILTYRWVLMWYYYTRKKCERSSDAAKGERGVVLPIMRMR